MKQWKGTQIYLSEAWSGEAFTGTIHSVFHKVVNMLTEQGTLLALIQKDYEPFPGAMVLGEVVDFSLWHLKEGQVVCYQDKCLAIGHEDKICATFQNAVPKSGLVLPKSQKAVSEKMVSSMCHLTKVYGEKSSLYDAVSAREPLDELGKIFQAEVQEIVQQNRQQEEMADVHKMYQSIDRITGLGIGLTPSGDDFLNGFFLSSYYLQKAWRENFPFTEYIKRAEKNTGAVSAAMLKNAWHGRARQSLVDLFTALEEENWQKGKQAVHKVLAYGSTSGTDTMCGVLAGLL